MKDHWIGGVTEVRPDGWIEGEVIYDPLLTGTIGFSSTPDLIYERGHFDYGMDLDALQKEVEDDLQQHQTLSHSAR